MAELCAEPSISAAEAREQLQTASGTRIMNLTKYIFFIELPLN
jgi:hypothetical protein